MKKLLYLFFLIISIHSVFSQDVAHRDYIEFNGKDQYLSLEIDDSFREMERSDMTVTLWFKGDRTITYVTTQRLLSALNFETKDEAKALAYELITMNNMRNHFVGLVHHNMYAKDNKYYTDYGNITTRHELHHWYHLALVLDRQAQKQSLYLDGKLIYQQKLMPITNETLGRELILGARKTSKGIDAHFGGAIDNLRFYNKAFNKTEVTTDRLRQRVTRYTPQLQAGFDFADYVVGASEIMDVTGRYNLKCHHYPALSQDKLVKSYAQHSPNGNLIGRGKGQPLGVIQLGLAKASYINQLTVQISGTIDPKHIQSLKVYATDNGDRYDHRASKTLLLQANGQDIRSNQILLTRVANAPAVNQYAKLWLVAELSDKTPEGATLIAKIGSFFFADTTKAIFTPQAKPFAPQEVIITRQLVWTPSENHSAHYRIPSLITLDNGNLVSAIDKRKNSEYDLPENIDIEVKISRDNGLTWSEPILVTEGRDDYGFGDAALATDGKNIYMVMVAGSGLWYYPKYAKKPLDMYCSISEDGGLTWSKVRKISEEVYTNRYPNGGFFGSGNGIVTKDGRVIFVAAMRTDERWGGNMDNVLVYSDDKGQHWQSSPMVRHNGDESKVEELANGDLIVSSRNRLGGANARTYLISKDKGLTWSKEATWQQLMGNACNAGIRRYTKGYSASWTKGRENWLLHTLPSSARRDHLRIYLSKDNGKTWDISREICVGESVYSEITVLKDGSIAIISEENDRPGFDIYFTRFSLNWLERGKKNYQVK